MRVTPDVIDKLAKRSSARNLPFRVEGEHPHRILIVDPVDENGFGVGVTEDENYWVVSFGENGTHDHVREPVDLFEIVAFALSDRARLREVWRGSFWQRGILETRTPDGWERVTETGLFFFPFWRRKGTTIRQNKIIYDYRPTNPEDDQSSSSS